MAKYFSTTKKGEIHDLKEELNSPKEEKKCEAVKKVIAAMTEGKDVSMLFTDVLNCMQTHNLELKKLVYLYVMNYAKTQPDRAILAVNTFQKDASDPNPLIRALAVRTMGCIRVDKITEYLTQPLALCLKDTDPYVRKTAAVCVAKLYDINPGLVVAQGFLDMLKDLLADSNPMVVANAVASLREISEISGESVFKVDSAVLTKLLAALNECTEWGQVFILDSLAAYKPKDPREAESIAERVAIRLNHSNSAVVLSSVKVVLLCLEVISSQEVIRTYIRKLAPPLITLLSGGKEPEIQYVALRNINLIVQRQPEVLKQEIKMFFCKYNDPIYVKMEKLELMIMLSSDANIDVVLPEFKEYATMVDVEFVRKAVRAIGRCAIKLESAAERCISVLLELIQTKVNYVVQEAVVVIKDIFRKYPNRYESIIATLCENLETLDEPEAKASMCWIIGEYADRIDNAGELLDRFLESFSDESAQVQLQLLTAVVKLFLKKPKNTGEMVQKILKKATTETDNPDLRDRGFMYWRLLSTDPEAAKSVVLGENPVIKDTSSTVDEELLVQLIGNLGTLASIFHRPPGAFVSKVRKVAKAKPEGEEEEEPEYERDDSAASATAPAAAAAAPPASSQQTQTRQASLIDLDILGGPVPAAAPAAVSVPKNPMEALASLVGVSAAEAAAPAQKEVMLTAERGAGMELRGAFVRSDRQVCMLMSCTNRGAVALSQFAMQFNKNSFSWAPLSLDFGTVLPGATAEATVLIANNGPLAPPPVSLSLQVAVKNSSGQIFYFVAQIPPHIVFAEGGPMEKDPYLALWRSIPEASELVKEFAPKATDVAAITRKLQSINIYETARRQLNGNDVLYISGKTANGMAALGELTVRPGGGCRLASRAQETSFATVLEQALSSTL
jgi:AP-1 complex subunit beta-1